MRAQKHGTDDIQNAGDKNGLAHGNGLGSDRRGHGVCHVIGPDVPGHVKAEDVPDDENDRFRSHSSVLRALKFLLIPG